ncbi:MAG: hypothetical protein HY290_23120 [Planctomycetia bacterium]|nr:hypothetical protein [Planctomycetia bacterium]
MKSIKALFAACLACGTLVSAVRVDAAPIPSATQYTNRLQFRIPFHYDPGELSRLGARQIRLYVSRDKGRSWEQGESVLPNAGKFTYRAATDGEYWFLVRTLDSKNQLHPDLTVTDPGLQVVVDTTPPKLEIELRQPVAGSVQLSWNASDDHLDPTQLRLEYLQPGSSEWQDLSIVPKASGQRDWKIPQGGVVAVRGSIADLAKNTTTDQVQLRILPANQAVPRPGAPESRQPVAGPGSDLRENVVLNLPDKFPSDSMNPKGETPPAEQGLSANSRLPVERNPMGGLSPNSPKGNFVSHKPDDRLASAAEAAPGSRPVEMSRIGAAGRKRVVDSRKFQIGYNLEGVGPSGVSSVDLYITDDNGATWYHYGVDDDNISPIYVEVPSEGTYGFCLGVRSGAGLSSDPPQNGDAPSIVVVVDQTTPTLELLPVQQGLGKNINKLLISWKCADANLPDRPISLFYSATGQAPWLPISGPLENTGSHVWSIGAGVPVKFYLRIEARDLAGHVQTLDSPQPIVIDLSRPTAKIIDVESPAAGGLPR